MLSWSLAVIIVCAVQLLLLYLAGGIAGSLAHVTQYYIQAQNSGNFLQLVFPLCPTQIAKMLPSAHP